MSGARRGRLVQRPRRGHGRHRRGRGGGGVRRVRHHSGVRVVFGLDACGPIAERMNFVFSP